MTYDSASYKSNLFYDTVALAALRSQVIIALYSATKPRASEKDSLFTARALRDTRFLMEPHCTRIIEECPDTALIYLIISGRIFDVCSWLHFYEAYCACVCGTSLSLTLSLCLSDIE